MYNGTFGLIAALQLSACKGWWAMTGSNRRPSRCKQGVSHAKQPLPANLRTDFLNLCRFRFGSVPPWCTLVHAGSDQRWSANRTLITNAIGARYD